MPYAFHDFRSDGLDAQELERWVDAVGWETLLNRRGTTWRRLAANDRNGLDRARAVALMLAEPALIRRPVLVNGESIQVGFTESDYAKLSGN